MSRRIVTSKSLVKCPHCSEEVYKTNFCSQCGEPLVTSDLAQVCSKGHVNRQSASFCADCGETLPFWRHVDKVCAVVVLSGVEGDKRRFRIHKRFLDEVFLSAYDAARDLKEKLPEAEVWVVRYCTKDNSDDVSTLKVYSMRLVKFNGLLSDNMVILGKLSKLELAS